MMLKILYKPQIPQEQVSKCLKKSEPKVLRWPSQSPDQRSCITQESPRAVTFVRNWLGKSLKTRTKWLLSVSRPYRLVILDTGVVFPTKYCMQVVHRSGGRGGGFASPFVLHFHTSAPPLDIFLIFLTCFLGSVADLELMHDDYNLYIFLDVHYYNFQRQWEREINT